MIYPARPQPNDCLSNIEVGVYKNVTVPVRVWASTSPYNESKILVIEQGSISIAAELTKEEAGVIAAQLRPDLANIFGGGE